MIFDPTKPVRTRDGRPARILATDLKGEDPIAAAVLSLFSGEGAEEVIHEYQEDGRYIREREHELDLLNVPERTFKFVNVYAGGTLGMSHRSESGANGAERAGYRIGLLKIILEGSRLVNVEVV